MDPKMATLQVTKRNNQHYYPPGIEKVKRLTGNSDEGSPGHLGLVLHIDLKCQENRVNVKLEGQYTIAV